MDSTRAFAYRSICRNASARAGGGTIRRISVTAVRAATAVRAHPFGSRERRPILKIRRSAAMHTLLPAETNSRGVVAVVFEVDVVLASFEPPQAVIARASSTRSGSRRTTDEGSADTLSAC